ncbi:hypothetical protein GCM10010435_79840 [Winogradskya consettensis]|uniref:Zinc-ribbon 15 domain-containing protein n=1 Tax=Winogradskya consettensis TaxID=113560 RepID=A0A919VW84_9ACTN|nr:zinc-ribbon domain-containing protein [Actinoplanes consettensis]GIM77395.1 hypothetical protein Aco04nite_55130 [Actinoplanes consettensis]
MFLLFGLRSKDYLISVTTMICEVCGWNAPQTLIRRTTKFTLFFVPLFPVRPSRQFLSCGHCQAYRPAPTGTYQGTTP